MQKYISIYFVLVSMLALPMFAFGQITGRVFDNGNSGEKMAHTERPIAGISIKAYGLLPSGKYGLISQTQSDAKGRYYLDVPEGKQVRILFDGKLRKLQSNTSTPAVMFVKSPASEVNWGGYHPAQYVSDKPFLVSPVYTTGKGNDSATALKAVSLDDTVSFSLASSNQVGALWAVAFDKNSNHLYSAAFAKRHVGFGPLGSGGIYRTDWHTKVTVPWLDLKTIGIPTGDDHHQGLKVDVDSNSTDALLMADVGKLGLGGIDISEDGKVLYVMNLYNRALYAINIPEDTAARPTSADVTSFVIPSSPNNSGSMRPFAVKAHEGKIYVGVISDAEKSQMLSDLSASVYALDPDTKKFTLVFSMPMDYVRGKAVNGLDVESWYPWTDDFNKALHPAFPSTATRPQPILSSIVFDGNGTMFLGIMDRFGHQSGTGQPTPDGKASYSAVAAGDVLRVYIYASGNKSARFELENNALAGELLTDGKDNRQGPRGGEFFFQDGFTYKDEKRQALTVHEETGAGGLALLPATNELLMTAHEPTDSFNSGGIKAFFTEDGRTSRGWLLYGNGQSGTFGKANGVGGLAVTSGLPGVVIGNRVWSDTNADGIQDPDEPGLPGIELGLWLGDSLMGTTLSDLGGHYLFDEENVKEAIQPNTLYQIKIKLDQPRLTPGIGKSQSDAELDNDGIRQGGYSVASFKTGKMGENIHTIDFGFLDTGKRENIATSEDGELIAYPNPAYHNVIAETNSQAASATFDLIDGQGRVIENEEVIGNNGRLRKTYDLSTRSSGIYIIRISEAGVSAKTVKVIKE
ncbi:SdrD B-like domain-containing protein [Dyadobacter sp. 22481]|uniref:SdrD B-like domain-containing protein n=1 Tax=Dyadobacter sp. 22481 TaxID=3453926 RepID=UPI003F85F9FB